MNYNIHCALFFIQQNWTLFYFRATQICHKISISIILIIMQNFQTLFLKWHFLMKYNFYLEGVENRWLIMGVVSFQQLFLPSKLFQLNIRWVFGWQRIRRKIQFVFGLQLHMADNLLMKTWLQLVFFHVSQEPSQIAFFNSLCAFSLCLSLSLPFPLSEEPTTNLFIRQTSLLPLSLRLLPLIWGG